MQTHSVRHCRISLVPIGVCPFGINERRKDGDRRRDAVVLCSVVPREAFHRGSGLRQAGRTWVFLFAESVALGLGRILVNRLG